MYYFRASIDFIQKSWTARFLKAVRLSGYFWSLLLYKTSQWSILHACKREIFSCTFANLVLDWTLHIKHHLQKCHDEEDNIDKRDNSTHDIETHINAIQRGLLRIFSRHYTNNASNEDPDTKPDSRTNVIYPKFMMETSDCDNSQNESYSSYYNLYDA